jgi:hypothetical protein
MVREAIHTIITSTTRYYLTTEMDSLELPESWTAKRHRKLTLGNRRSPHRHSVVVTRRCIHSRHRKVLRKTEAKFAGIVLRKRSPPSVLFKIQVILEMTKKKGKQEGIEGLGNVKIVEEGGSTGRICGRMGKRSW